jgi:hypothetical protein
MDALELERFCEFISEGQYRREMAALRKKAAQEREEMQWKPTNSREAERVGLWKVLLESSRWAVGQKPIFS